MTDDIQTLRSIITYHVMRGTPVQTEAIAALGRLQARIAELEQRLFPKDCPPADQERDHLAEQCVTLGRENVNLQAIIVELEKERDERPWIEKQSGKIMREMSIENQGMHWEVQEQTKRRIIAESERDSLRAKLERAKEALEPFKTFLDANEQTWADYDTTAVSTGEGRTHDVWLTFGHIRRARAVLAELSADAPAQQAQISDEALDAGWRAFCRTPGAWFDEMASEDDCKNGVRAAITAANEWGK